MIRVLLIDNFDSFTYNLAHGFAEAGADEVVVRRNDAITVAEAVALAPTHLVISPGPGTPDQTGVSADLIHEFAGTIPILGVCLGHQCIAEVFGGTVIQAPRQVHGKTSSIHHNNNSIFKNLPNPFSATRYHSLIVDREKLPDCLEITASTAEGEIMGLRHRELPIWGVQFHPESILTIHGKELLGNFLTL